MPTSSRTSTPSRAWRVGSLLVISASIAALVTYLHSAHLLDSFEMRWFDALGQVFVPEPSGRVAVVDIADSDFADPTLFGGVSPLDPGTIARILRRLAEHRPSVVAVDVLLEPVPYEAGDRLEARLGLYALISDLAREGPTVWVFAESDQLPTQGLDPSAETAWRELRATIGRSRLAVPWLVVDEGLVRRAMIRVPGDGDSTRPTLLGAIAATRMGPDLVAHHDRVLIRYTGVFSDTPLFNVSVGDLLRPTAGPTPDRDTLLTDRVLILGGSHEAGRDYFWTPIGRMAAVQIWAEATDAWLRDDEPKELNHFLAWSFETFLGFAGGLLLVALGPVVGLALSLVGIATFTVISSSLSFAYGFAFLNSLPSFIGICLHDWIELWRSNRELRAHLK